VTGNTGSHTVSLLDVHSGSFVKSWPVPNVPEALNITPDGTEIWVGSNQTGKLTVIDIAANTVTTIAEGFGWPYRVAFTPSMNSVLVPDLRNEELRFFDRNTRRERSRLALKDAGPQGITFTPDGRYAFLSLSKQARVAIVDVDRQMIAGYLATGETPDGVAYTRRTFPSAMPASTARPTDVASIDSIISVLYASISGGAGVKRDWSRFLSLFAPGARLIPTGRRPDGTQVMRSMTPEEYSTTIGPQLEASGFFEREIGRETAQFGAVAHVFSAYDSKRLETDPQPFARGINSIQLFNDGRRWWVVTIFWDSERPDNMIPPKYLGIPVTRPPGASSPATARVRVGTRTRSATLFVDTVSYGPLGVPRFITLPAGREFRMSIRAPNCRPWDTTFTLRAGRDVTLGYRNPRCP
jgi:hypothetical protein